MKASDGAEKKRSSEAAHSTLALFIIFSLFIFFSEKEEDSISRSDTDSRNSYRNYTERGPSVGISKFLFDIFVGWIVMRESKC